MTDPTTTTDFHALIAKEENLLVPTGKTDRYSTVVETVRRVMDGNMSEDVFVAISAMEEQQSAKRLCSDIYEDACNEAQCAFDAAVSNLDEPWCTLIEDSGAIDASEWVDQDIHHAVCELDILDQWKIPMARVLAEYLYFFDGEIVEALANLPRNLCD
jgi:hypothetical protein